MPCPSRISFQATDEPIASGDSQTEQKCADTVSRCLNTAGRRLSPHPGTRRWICALFAAALLTACARTDDRAILGMLRTQLAKQYHECVPLGWSPVPNVGTYYPGISVTVQENGVWLPAVWVARVRRHDLARPDVRTAAAVLDELTRKGVLERTPVRDGFRYRLTRVGWDFYYDENDYGNNPDHIPYLCYSTIVPQRVVWSEPARRERSRDGSHDEDVFRAAFAWRQSPVAAWANDAFLRTHSVTMGPTENQLTATFANRHGEWIIVQLGTPTPTGRVVDPSAWPRPRR